MVATVHQHAETMTGESPSPQVLITDEDAKASETRGAGAIPADRTKPPDSDSPPLRGPFDCKAKAT